MVGSLSGNNISPAPPRSLNVEPGSLQPVHSNNNKKKEIEREKKKKLRFQHSSQRCALNLDFKGFWVCAQARTVWEE